MTTAALTSRDDRPYFTRALAHGLATGLLSASDLARIEADAPKGIVQIADHFGTAYLQTDLETGLQRMLCLMSLYLEAQSQGDVHRAALSLRDNSLLSHSRGGSEMLKRLHALPADTGLYPRPADPAAQKQFVNERSFAFPLSLDAYQRQCAEGQENQARIDFARWLARQMGTAPNEGSDFSAEEIIRSAMLVLLVQAEPLELPGKRQFVRHLSQLREKRFAPSPLALERFIAQAPEDFAARAKRAFADFIREDLPTLRDPQRRADEILHEAGQGSFFVRENLAEDLQAYDELVASTWVRLTRGEADDPTILATLFLNIATGQPPSAKALLLREGKSLIGAFRQSGFNSAAVEAFIDHEAPFEQRPDLKAFWNEDLKPEAEVHLADHDPNMPDQHMERALRYLKSTCAVRWKGRS